MHAIEYIYRYFFVNIAAYFKTVVYLNSGKRLSLFLRQLNTIYILQTRYFSKNIVKALKSRISVQLRNKRMN